MAERETGFYWVKINGQFILSFYNSCTKVWYEPGQTTRFTDEVYSFISDEAIVVPTDEAVLLKRKTGYYWVKLIDMDWVICYYDQLKKKFYFNGKLPDDMIAEIDETPITRHA